MDASSARYDFDCIVIGSGFGGAVTACRLAEGNRRVLVLERGDSYPPGSFPRTPLATSTNVWDPKQRLYGMFDIWSFRKFEAIVSSGLGGGSLIYANVMLRKPEAWFRGDGAASESWPLDYADLEGCYEKAERVLGATPYPYAERTAKSRQLRDAAPAAGLTWQPAPLAVSFSPPGQPLGLQIGRPGDNLHQVPRTTCRLCGECDVGCNSGSKNSTDLTYLSTAWRHHATIKTLHEVRLIKPIDGQGPGYEVVARRHRPPKERWCRDGEATPPERVSFTARTVVVAAGALGSTYLLLRNRARLPDLSTRLGTQFCCNGDYLGFIRAPKARVFDASRAPVITSYLTTTDRGTGEPAASAGIGRDFVIQDGGYPVLADWFSESLGIRPVGRVLQVAWTLLQARLTSSPRTEISGRLAEIVGDSRRSRGVVPLLGMGRDVPGGQMQLRDDSLDISWKQAYSDPVFRSIRSSMVALASSLGGGFYDGPSSMFSRLLTVHPLGGAPMGADVDHGVVDSYGEVFNYPGLFVVDGSVMPGPVGVNPALTIAALAERFSARVLERSA
ncbi:MAG: GMC oxidoreductase [Propionibacteriaceae bacterium]